MELRPHPHAFPLLVFTPAVRYWNCSFSLTCKLTVWSTSSTSQEMKQQESKRLKGIQTYMRKAGGLHQYLAVVLVDVLVLTGVVLQHVQLPSVDVCHIHLDGEADG